MAVSLEDFDALLESKTRDLLGDTITYIPAGGAPLTLKAVVDYSDTDETLGSSRAASSDVAIEVPVSIIATVSSGDVVTLPRTGLNYQPRQSLRDESGMSWLILLKVKP